MTVSSEVDSVSYAGNGVTVLFPVSYYFLADSHLQVILQDPLGVGVVQVLNSQYTVLGAGNQSGGSVTMVAPPAAGYTLIITRDQIPMTQETDYVPNDPFPAESHERALDKLTMLVQQGMRLAGRALPLNAQGTAWDAQDKQIKNLADGDDPQDAVSLLQMQIYVGEHVSGASNFVNVRDFGAVGDGVTDDQPAFVAALAFSDSVYVPPGRYLIGTGNIEIREKRLWAEAGRSGGTWAAKGTTGAVLVTTQTTNPVLRLTNGGVIDGLQFYYPNQDGSGITNISGYPTIVGNPIIYPASIALPLGGANWVIRNCVFINSYSCISAGDPALVQGCGRGVVEGCSAFLIKYFFRGYQLLDQVIIRDFTISPGVIAGADAAKDKLYRWALRNSIAFWINKSDGLQVDTGIIYGADAGFAFVGVVANSLLKIRGVTLDGSRRFLDSDVTLSGALVSDCQLLCNTIEAANETYTPAIYLRGPNAPLFGDIQFCNLQVYQCLGEIIKVQGTGVTVPRLTLTNFQFMGWGKGTDTPANTAAVLIDSSGTNLHIADGFMRPGDTTKNGIFIAQSGRATIDNVELDGGASFANVSNTSYLRLANNRSFNTAIGTADVSLASVTEVYDTGNRWAVPPTSKQSNAPHFHARQAGTQTLANAATMQFTNEIIDQDGSFNSGTGVHTVQRPGRYLYDVASGFDAGTLNDVWALQLVTTQRTYQAIFTVESATVDKPLSLNVAADMRVGDTAQVIVTRISGAGTFSTVSGGNGTWFTGTLMDSA